MSQEPEYLQRLRRTQEARAQAHAPSKGAAAAGATANLSGPEQEAVRWAKALAKGTELRSIRNLSGARFALLVRLQSASGVKLLSLDGLVSREAVVERVKPGATVGEEILGAYEVRGGRPVTIQTDPEGQIQLKMGTPRPGANPVSPEKMIRKAEAEAAEREKTRPKRDDRGSGGRR